MLVCESEVNSDLDNVAANTHNDDPVLITNKSDLKLLSTDCQFGEIAMIFELLEEVPDSSYCQFQRYFHLIVVWSHTVGNNTIRKAITFCRTLMGIELDIRPETQPTLSVLPCPQMDKRSQTSVLASREGSFSDGIPVHQPISHRERHISF